MLLCETRVRQLLYANAAVYEKRKKHDQLCLLPFFFD